MTTGLLESFEYRSEVLFLFEPLNDKNKSTPKQKRPYYFLRLSIIL